MNVEMVLGLAACTRVAWDSLACGASAAPRTVACLHELVTDGDGLDLQPRASWQPCYTDQRARRPWFGEERGAGVVDSGRVDGIDEVHGHRRDGVERQPGGAELVAQSVEGAARLLGGGAADDRAALVHRQLRRDEDEMPRRDGRRVRAGRRRLLHGSEGAAGHDLSLPVERQKGASGRAASAAAPRPRSRLPGAQTSRIFAARIAALRAPLMATQATGTPGGICTMLSSESLSLIH